jgi:GNAT superfamily N-acetyltransferase
VIDSRTNTCDFAIVIADDWHKTGIAGLLMNALIAAARAHGVAAMESQVLGSNSDMLRFARGLGFEVQRIPDELTVLRIVKKLQAGAEP